MIEKVGEIKFDEKILDVYMSVTLPGGDVEQIPYDDFDAQD